ncbi:MAG TPA: HAMP domain-containing sensor histidine kinase [Candidatus Dormibacteraeota bacterium]|nr:HAMP domain-containing sensor histidine kinase [Candidatus Dormibacteraeota bacterium]
MTARERLAESMLNRRSELVAHLCELEWAADPADPKALIADRERVRPRVELFLDTLLLGLSSGSWARFDATIGSRTVDLLAAGVITASQLEQRALALTTFLIEPTLTEEDAGPLLAELFGAMQTLSGRIVGAYNERLQAESRQLDDLKTMFLRMTGHELRAPLGTIRGYVSMLLDGDLGEVGTAQRQAIDSIGLASASGLGILDRLGEIARLESRTEALHRAAHRLAGVVDTALEPLRGSALHKKVEIRLDIRDDEVDLDADEVAIAIRNLVGNAFKYASGGGVVTVSASRRGGDAIFEVTDRGPGIPESELQLVFDRYYRSAVPSGELIPGSGLGLYIVRRIAELHGGTATVENVPGGGARFRITIPRHGVDQASIGAEGQS